MIKEKRRAYCIMFDDRFFSQFGRDGRVLTYWALSGSMLLMSEDAARDKLAEMGPLKRMEANIKAVDLNPNLNYKYEDEF